MEDFFKWQSILPAYIDALESHKNKIKNFVIDSASQFKSTPPPAFSLGKESDFYKELKEVYAIGNSTIEKGDISVEVGIKQGRELGKFMVEFLKMRKYYIFFTFLLVMITKINGQSAIDSKILKYNWAIQSSKKISEKGDLISNPEFEVNNWYSAIMPSTILEALVKNGVVKNPYFGNHLAEAEGFFTPEGYLYDLPENSPYSVPWWFRTEFNLPKEDNFIWLNLSSINYKANIWLNGHLIADTHTIEGVHRLYELDITDYVKRGGKNCLAFEIIPPIKSTDLSIRWMQGSRMVPDKNAGIWYDVKIVKNNTLKIRYPHVITDLDLPNTSRAYITVETEILNQSEKDVHGILNGLVKPVNNLVDGGSSSGGKETYEFKKEVFIKAKSSKKIKVLLEIKDAHLWWPFGSGKQNLYDLSLHITPNEEKVSDMQKIRFGIREVSSYLQKYEDIDNHVRVFKINGKDIFIKGGNWTETLMMEDNPKRNEAEILHMRNMHFNAIRTEGFWGSDHFFDLCDKYGIMIFDGFNCCSIWERWDKWSEHTFEIAGKSLRDQVVRKRNHPSFVDWLLGSDNPVPFKVEKMYVDILEKYDGTRPYQSNAAYSTTPICGCSGIDHDPYPDTYTYLPPSTWYGMREVDKDGYFGPNEFLEFNTEVGPGGEVIPPIESMRAMFPKKDLWPPNKSWEMRLSSDSLSVLATNAFYKRYGKPLDLESYTIKAQVFQKESFRAMTEAFRKNKYKASGILIYRLNAGWPSMCYYLYDYYLRPNGAYSGVQQGFEPLHVLYAYDDHSVVIVNDLYQNFENLKVTIEVFNMDMIKEYSKIVNLSIGADQVKTALRVPEIKDLKGTYFLNLKLTMEDGDLISSNFYWLTTQEDQEADFTDLEKLLSVKLKVSAEYQIIKTNAEILVRISNPTDHLAFFINPKVLIGLHGKELLPTYWNAKYFSLLPSETREVKVTFNNEDLKGKAPYLMLEGWNVDPLEIALDASNKQVTPVLSYNNIMIPKSVNRKQKFDISVFVTNAIEKGNALFKSQQYLYIDDQPISFKRVSLAPREGKVLEWDSLEINKSGIHTIKIGNNKPTYIKVK